MHQLEGRLDRGESLGRVVESAVSSWRSGSPANARMVLDEFPELALHRSLLFDLVTEDFRHRRSAGEMLGPQTYREQYESFGLPLAQSIERVIALEEVAECHSSDSAEKATVWPKAGDEFERFLVVEELGRGSFARVYHCLERGVGDRPVALKVSRKPSPEADRLGRLSHPNIVPILSAYHSHENRVTITAMPLLGVLTLAEVSDFAHVVPNQHRTDALQKWLLDSGKDVPSPPTGSLVGASYEDWLLLVAEQICSALEYAHSKGVVHCDIKPSNILVTPEGSPLLIDFNLSCVQSGSESPVIGGTLEYMPPEFWNVLENRSACTSDGMGPSPSLDIYALAVTLAEAVLGVRPLPEDSAGTMSRPSAGEAYARQSQLVAEAISKFESRELGSIWARCLHIKPALRPNASALREALQSELQARSRNAVPKRFTRRRSLIVGSCVAISAFPIGRYFGPVESRRRSFGEALEMFDSNQFDEVILILNRLISSDPESLSTRYLRAWTQLKRNLPFEARQDFGAIASMGSGDGHIENCVAYTFCAQGNLSAGIPWYRKVFDGAPRAELSATNNFGCCLWLGRDSSDLSINDQSLYIAALDWLDKAREIAPHAPEPVLNQMLCYLDEAVNQPSQSTERFESNPRWPEEYLKKIGNPMGAGEVKLVAAVFLANLQNSPQVKLERAKRYLSQAIVEGFAPPIAEWDADLAYAPFRNDLETAPYRRQLHSEGYSLKHALVVPTMQRDYLLA